MLETKWSYIFLGNQTCHVDGGLPRVRASGHSVLSVVLLCVIDVCRCAHVHAVHYVYVGTTRTHPSQSRVTCFLESEKASMHGLWQFHGIVWGIRIITCLLGSTTFKASR